MGFYSIVAQNNEYLIDENVLLKNLVDGCQKHPSYRAKREPKCECARCHDMWAVRQNLNELYSKIKEEVSRR